MTGPRLVVLCGPPFSGKSVLARRLADAAGAVLVSYDDLWRERRDATGLSLGYDDLRALAESRLRDALADGRAALYDTLNDTPDARERLRRLAEDAGAGWTLLWCDTPLRTRRERRRRNRIAPTRHDVPSDRLRAATAAFVPPGDDENPVVARPRTPLRNLLPQIGIGVE